MGVGLGSWLVAGLGTGVVMGVGHAFLYWLRWGYR